MIPFYICKLYVDTIICFCLLLKKKKDKNNVNIFFLHSTDKQFRFVCCFFFTFNVWQTNVGAPDCNQNEKNKHCFIDYEKLWSIIDDPGSIRSIIENFGYLSTIPTLSSRSALRNVRKQAFTCSEREWSMLRASMARPRYSLTSSSGSFWSWSFPKPSLQDKWYKKSL